MIKKELSDNKVRQYERAVLDSLLAMLAKYEIVARIKLPNDLYVNDKKIAGILIETKRTEGIYDYLIVGIGLNVNQQAFSDHLPATSMSLEMKKDILVEDAFTSLTKELESRFRAWYE